MLLLSFRRTQACVKLRAHYSTQLSATPPPKKPFDILFFGRDEFSCLVLAQLFAARDVWQHIWIVTQPDMKTGRRGSVLSVSPLKTLGEDLEIPVHTIPPDKPSFKHWQPPHPFTPILDLPPPPERLLVTASFGRILPNSLLDLFLPGRRLNVHPSLLPMYRGPAPIQRALMDGKKETGVCVIEMMEKKRGIDAGEIWGQRHMAVPDEAEFSILRDALAIMGGNLLVSVLRDMIEGKAVSTAQALDPNARRAPPITAEDALINFSSLRAEVIVQRHRAISHQKPLFAYLKTGKTLQLLSPIVHRPLTNLVKDSLTEPGMMIFDPTTRSFVIRCAHHTYILVKEVKQQDRSQLNARQWWNGVRPEMTVPVDAGKKVVMLSHIDLASQP